MEFCFVKLKNDGMKKQKLTTEEILTAVENERTRAIYTAALREAADRGAKEALRIMDLKTSKS